MYFGLRPRHIRGSASSAARSRRCSRDAVIPDAIASVRDEATDTERSPGCGSTSGTEFLQKLVRRNPEGVGLQRTADDHHRVCAEDVDQYVAAKLGGIVQSYDRILVSRQHVIQARFVLDEIVHARKILEGPFHVSDQPGQRKSLGFPAVEHFLDQGKHGVLVEVALAQVCLVPGADLELSALLRG